MKAGAIEVGGPVLSFTSTVPSSSNEDTQQIAEREPSESPSESENEIEDVEISEPSTLKKQAPPEPEP